LVSCDISRKQAGPAADLDGGGCREDESLVRLRRHAGKLLTDIAPESYISVSQKPRHGVTENTGIK
jgi:hypothetical protein